MDLRFIHRAWKARFGDQRPEIEAALGMITQDDLVLDIGANKGAYLYWLRKAVGPGGQVVAFEPQKPLHAYLQRMAQKMHWTNVTIECVALSDTPGRSLMHVPAEPGGHAPGASFVPKSTWARSYQFECEHRPLDGYQFDRRVSFIKCDVEGHELRVFKGARRLLIKDGPAVLFECEARHLGTSRMDDVFGFLEALGYDGRFFSEGTQLAVREFSVAIHQRRRGKRFWDQPGYCNNFLFQPRAGP